MKKQEKELFIEETFKEMYGKLKSLAYYYSNDKGLVEDILQETYLAAFMHADELIGNEKYKGWFCSTTITQAKRMNRMSLKHRKCESLEEHKDLTAEMEYELINYSELKNVLTDEDLKLLLLHHEYGYTYQEISDMFNKKPSYTKTRISRAIKKIRNVENLQ